MVVINYVKLYRNRMGLKQENLSKLANVGRSTISNIETGRYTPGVDIALTLAKAMKCTVEDLFELVEGGQ